jgi:hypothetical protein
MSKSDNFDTDIDIDQEPAPAQDDQEQEQAQEEQISEEQEPPKPKGGLLVKGIIALAVVGGIGFYFLKPSGVQAPTDTAMPVAQVEPQPIATDMAPAPSTPLPETVLEQPKQATAVIALPAPESQPEPKSSDAPAMPAASPSSASAPPASAASEDPLAWGGPVTKASTAPAMMPEPSPSPAPALPAAETAAPSSAAIPEAAAPVAEKTIPDQDIPKVSAAAQEKVDALEKRLAALEETITSLQARALTKADIEALAATVDKMQQEQGAEKAKAEAEEKVKTEAAAAKTQAKVKEKTKPAVPKVKRAKTAPVSSHAQSAPAAAPDWVLKSAKPGMAWVAEKGSGELSTISVGGALRGIGKITSIEKDSSGRWVVNGTEGKISQ